MMPYKLCAQNENGNNNVTDTLKKTKKERKNIDGSTEVFLLNSWSNSTRVIEQNNSVFSKSLGKLTDEKSLKIWSFGLGFRNYLSKHFVFEGGISLLRNGESYAYQQSDSSFNYETKYTYMAMPIRFQYVRGSQIKFFAGASIFPQMLMRYKQAQHWTNSKNENKKLDITDKEYYNSIVLSAGVNVGLQIKISKFTSLFVMPEYRWQLTNSLLPINSYRHYARVFSLNFGLTYQL